MENPKRSLWVLAAIYGFSSLLNIFESFSLGTFLGALPIVLLAAVFSPLWGYLVFAIWSWLVQWTGRWLGGSGTFLAVRAAYAWSCVPLTVNGVLWLFLIVLFGRDLFLNFSAGLYSQNQVTLLFLILIAKVILAIWSLVIYLHALSEVQQFSLLRAIGNLLIAGILLTVAVGILWALAMPTSDTPFDHSKAAFYFWYESSLLEAFAGRL